MVGAYCRYKETQEAETKEIQVSIGNEFVLSLFVDYLYMGDYDDETPLYLNRNEEVSTAPPSLPPIEQAEISKPQSGYVFLDDTTMLMANAYLYLLADYYQIPGLLNLSAAKFRTAMSHKIDLSDFHKVVSLMYGSDEAIFARELREYVNSAIVENAASLIKVDAFMEQCQQQPMMAAIVLPMLVEHYETRLKEQRESLRHLQH